MSLLPNALESFVQLTGVVRDRMPFVCLDIDGPLSEIVGSRLWYVFAMFSKSPGETDFM